MGNLLMPFRNEEELIRACIAKKRRAQFAFYERYKGRMYAICLRYARNAPQAQDFLQEGFAKAFTALRQYRFEVPVEYWLRRIMINACISELRRKKEPVKRSVPIEEVSLRAEAQETPSPNLQGLSARATTLCATCHVIEKDVDLTGPSLVGITARREQQWLYDFTRNSGDMIQSGDPQALEVWENWRPTQMNHFEQLGDQELHDIYYYVANWELSD